MIEGLLRHLTSAEIDRNYTDMHGASIVGFAFTYLLGVPAPPPAEEHWQREAVPAESGRGEAWPMAEPGPPLDAPLAGLGETGGSCGNRRVNRRLRTEDWTALSLPSVRAQLASLSVTRPGWRAGPARTPLVEQSLHRAAPRRR